MLSSSPDFLLASEHSDGDEVRLRVEVPADLVFFEGHFEGNPMLPGVAQVLALIDAHGRRVFGEILGGRGARRLSRLKFQATIRPADRLDVTLSLVRGAEPQVRFRIERVLDQGLELATSGALTYG